MDNNSEVVYLYLDDIIPNRFQPREVFDDQALKELAVSIREHGVIQPIIVRKVENKYEIIAGERRYKASTMAGLTKIPAIVKNLDDKESSKVALIENLQRRDLSPIEEARTYQKILELEDSMTQEQLAETIGKTQSSVSNKLRLLSLPEEVQDALLKEKISERHARSLLNVEDKNDQIKLMDKVIAEKMTVRDLDKEIKEMKDGMTGQVNDNIIEPNQLVNSNQIITESNVDSTTPESSPTVALADFSQSSSNGTVNNNETTPGVAPAVEKNPTSIDIDRIRQISTDINPTVPQGMNVQDLLKDPATETKEEFKFFPSFDAAPTVAPTSAEPNILPGFSTNVDNANNMPSSILTPEISVPSATPLRDVNVAINDVKAMVDKLKTDGYNINVEEADDVNEFKITIQINKNS